MREHIYFSLGKQGVMTMLVADLQTWFIDLLACFSVLIFLYFLKLILILSKNINLTIKELSSQFTTLIRDGQANLLVVTYNISVIRNLFSLKYIPYFKTILVALLIVIIIYNVILYVLVKEIGYIKDEKVTPYISLLSLLFSVVGSLIYTIVQGLQ